MIKSISEAYGEVLFDKHKIVFDASRHHELALCGSTAVGLFKDEEDGIQYTPPDLDFVCGSALDANLFLHELSMYMFNRRAHFRFYFNCRNNFCPEPAEAHIRITSEVWLPICVFVIPAEKFKFFRIKGGVLVQNIKDVRNAAKELEKIDGKPRIAAMDFESDVLRANGGVIHRAEPDPQVGNVAPRGENPAWRPAPFQNPFAQQFEAVFGAGAAQAGINAAQFGAGLANADAPQPIGGQPRDVFQRMDVEAFRPPQAEPNAARYFRGE